MLFSHAQNTPAWDALAITEMLLTEPVMVVIGQKVGAFGAYRDRMGSMGAPSPRRTANSSHWRTGRATISPTSQGRSASRSRCSCSS